MILEGEWQIRKFKRGSDRPFAVEKVGSNTVVVSGIHRIIDLMLGLSSNRFNSNSILRIYSSAGASTPIRTLSGAVEGPIHILIANGGEFRITWGDDSLQSYTPANLRPFFPDGSTQLSTTNISQGTKLSTETWLFDYTFRLRRTVGGTFPDEGLDLVLRLMTGNQTIGFQAGNLELEVRDSTTFSCTGGTFLGTWNSNAVERDGTNAVILFEVAEGNLTGNWQCAVIRHNVYNIEFFRGPIQSPGNKLSSQIFRYFFRVLFTNA